MIYLASCEICELQRVGSTGSFKPRLANYKSHIKHKRRTCSIVNHFIDKHGADHSSLYLLFNKYLQVVADFLFLIYLPQMVYQLSKVLSLVTYIYIYITPVFTKVVAFKIDR